MPPSPSRTPRLLGAFVALLMLAAACSSSDTGETTAPVTVTEPTTTTVDDTEPDEDIPAPTTIPDAPAVFEGERVVAIGSNVWPIVGDLLSLGVTPVAIYSQLGNQEQPAYITEAYGAQLADVPVSYINLTELSPEEILLLEPDRVVMPDFFENLIATSDVWQTVLENGDNAIFIPVRNWQGSLGALAAAAGTDADASIADLQTQYDARVAAIADSLDYDPAEVLFNTFQWNEDGTYIPTLRDAPIVQIAEELGFQLHPLLRDESGVPLSLETVRDMDADLVFIQVRNIDFASSSTDPLWSTTEVAASGNVFQRFQFGQQAGWLETLELLDLLAVELPRYQSAG
ncbi:MAG: hypothetical protein AAF548_10085 [Actinomycetota bacterium]